MNLNDLTNYIESVVYDSTFTSAAINTLINEAYLAVATGVKLPDRYDLTPPLPDLYTTGTVSTGSSGVASLPVDYNRDVVQVTNSAGSEIPIFASFRQFNQKYPVVDTSSVHACSVNGSNLHYRGEPTTPENLTVAYYQTPTPLVNATDEPTAIPAVLHRQLIVGYVCKTIYDQIELGLSGPKVDTANYTRMFNNGLVQLVELIPNDNLPDYHDYEDL